MILNAKYQILNTKCGPHQNRQPSHDQATCPSCRANTTHATRHTHHAIRYTIYDIRTTFVQNKPNLHKSPICLNLCGCKYLHKKRQFRPPKSKPKQTQTKPIRPPFFARYRTPNQKQTQTNPISCKTGQVGSSGETLPNPPIQPSLVGFYGDREVAGDLARDRAAFAGGQTDALLLGETNGRTR